MENRTIEDEISLYEILLILKKHIKYLITIFLLGVTISVGFALLIPNKYRAEMIIYVNPSFDFLEMLETIKEKNIIVSVGDIKNNSLETNIIFSLLDSYSFRKQVKDSLLRERPRTDLPESKLYKVELNRKENTIVVSSELTDKELAKLILKTALNILQNNLMEWNRVSKYYQLTIRIVEEPTIWNKPVSPKRPLIIVVGFLISLFLSIFLIFVVESFKNYKKRRGE
ncbi:YveK family protein [Caldisericum exile]|uniref:YveK family protein n=1 Tax=Caldisericum exile TaxID=693075 RepID=UPI003C72C67B